MIKQVCSYCKKTIKEIEEDNSRELVSHGICHNCISGALAGTGQSLVDFLDTLPGAIFVIDGHGTILGANSEGLQCVSKDIDKIQDRLCGEVFECKHSKLPEGCGETIHCKSCTVRNTVTKTAVTGENCFQIPAYMDHGEISGDKTVKYLISTEKINEKVLLRIDDVQNIN